MINTTVQYMEVKVFTQTSTNVSSYVALPVVGVKSLVKLHSINFYIHRKM